ncbi:class I SAM-dependent methyltransferase [Dyella dinghuensis]|uniref:Class I SAM-dependent methyltransferase n=2 Tax=Dyella dinghuensis TaxID=1920169 RepID=A0A432LQ30_9GAMM|nr:class I SAM-dependent methyltransferase [Dyella dinghuensis]
MNGWGPDELEAGVVCPSCGSRTKALTLYQELHDNVEGIPGKWSIRRCSQCRSLYLDPRPKPEAIAKAYASYHTHDRGSDEYARDNGNSLFWKLANGYMNARYGSARTPALESGWRIMSLLPPLRQQLDYFYRHLPSRPGRLLDVGCGNGVFLLRAKAAGWDVVGLEPDPAAVAAARECGSDVRQGTLESSVVTGPFNVITAAHVIEHVHQPQLFLKRIFDLLAKDGHVWIATPNVQGMGHRWFGRAWRGLEPPRHMVLFSRKALRKLLEDAGFREITFLRRGRGSFYVLHASHEAALKEGRKKFKLPAPAVDLAASIFASTGEEWVVRAKKP